MFSEIENSGNAPVEVSGSDNVGNGSSDTLLKISTPDNSVSLEETKSDNLMSDKSDNTSGNLPDVNKVDVASPNSAISSEQPSDVTARPRPKRLIGSQRNPEAYRSQPTIKVVQDDPATTTAIEPSDQQPKNQMPENNTADKSPQKTDDTKANASVEVAKQNEVKNNFDAGQKKFARTNDANVAKHDNKHDDDDDNIAEPMDIDEKILKELMVPVSSRVAIPKLRDGKMSDDLEAEFDAVMGTGKIAGGAGSIDSLLQQASELADKEVIESGTKLKAKVMAIRGDSLFLDLGVREQGVVLINMFPVDAVPKVDDEIEVTVGKLDVDEGLYDVTVPLAAADVKDWSQLQEGMIVEAKITKSNSGGLECEVNRLRGFLPISQIDIFRVENLEQYIGQKLTCVVAEINPEKRNLVVSRREMINREREEQRKQLLAELAPGQIKEGIVRKIIDGGVFVDLGGVDGFVPISKLSWGRVRHPSEVVNEGRRIVVRVDKIEEGTNRISLTYRDDSSNPWSNIFEHFQEKTQVRGKVVKITAFGAFIELMPGVDGLVLISELSNKHVKDVHEVLKEGEWTDVFIVSIDTETKRIKLSIKELIPPEPEIADTTDNPDPNKTNDQNPQKNKRKQEGIAAPIKIKNTHKGPLKGGIGNNNGNGLFS
ncbi:MAG: S1 RNA-binding domain-containing protein [Planctomycetaceae bacterium]|jgi:small subunit ribosomal protein S1|nr:S1 RNA-binding domain-containing protein [Planctomycetaceae bacterium]